MSVFVSTTAVDYLERLVSEMTYYVWSGTVIACSHLTLPTQTRQNCLVLSVSAVWTELVRRQDNLQLFSLKYIQDYWKLGNWKLGRDKTRQFCSVSNPVHTTNTDNTRQSRLVRVSSV